MDNFNDNSFAPSVWDSEQLLSFVGTILDYRWFVLGLTLVAFLIGNIAATLSTPIYQATAMLQVEEKAATLPGLEDLSKAFGGDSSTQAELEILKSRSVVGEVIKNLDLTTRVTPTYFPYIGDYLHREFRPSVNEPFRPPLLGLDTYAWGGEKIVVERFTSLSRSASNTLTIQAGAAPTFSVTDSSGNTWRGRVGETLSNDSFTLFISELVARPNTRFVLSHRPWLRVTQQIQSGIQATETGRQTGIVKISYRNADADLAKNVVNEVARVYVDQNINKLSAEAQNSLDFIRGQIPYIKRELERAENAFNSYASDNQSIDVTAEIQGVLSQLVALDTRIQEVELERVELNRRFTSNHPTVLAADAQYQQLMSERARFNQRVEALPDTQQTLLSLRRDVEVASGIYELLLYKAQEMEVAKASTVGNVRIIDSAVVDRARAVAPRKSFMVMFSTLLGFALSIGLIILKRTIYRGVESADAIEKSGVAVFASVPFSREQERWDASSTEGAKLHKNKRRLRTLAQEEPSDLAVEMLRNLRTSLYFNLSEAPNKAVMISGPSPGVGKSFIAVNLANICAQAGQRILLIDADMSRGYLHRYTHTSNRTGLSDFLAGRQPLEDCIESTVNDNLNVITRGATPPNPSELLHHERLQSLIDTAGKDYDIILFDTPPLLAVTDASVIGNKCGNTLLVCRFDKTTGREITAAKDRLERDGTKVTGAVLNGVEKRLSNYYGYGGYYGYGYGYSYKSEGSS